MAITSPINTQQAGIEGAEIGAPDISGAPMAGGQNVAEPAGWRELRNDGDIQFDEFSMAPVTPPEPREPGWLDEVLGSIADFLAGLLAPIGQFLGVNWQILQWVLLGIVALFALYWIVATIGPLAKSRAAEKAKSQAAQSDPDWQPSQAESLALLEDADRLASQGRFDEATHLLLKRSVSQIAKSRPDWVEPSSTARELAALPALSAPARSAFQTISERVERSLFALQALNRNDWEAARAAYADFARQSITGKEGARA